MIPGLRLLISWLIRFSEFRTSRTFFNIRVRKYGNGMLPLKDRIFEEFDLGIAMSVFLIIFPSDNSTVVLEVFLIF